MKKLTALAVAALMLLALFAGCADTGTTTAPTTAAPTTQSGDTQAATTAAPTQSADVAKEITIGRDYDATSLDTQNINVDGSYNILFMISEGLVRNDNGIITPGVALSWEQSQGGAVYTFKLRDNAKWSDGSTLNAHDFEYSFKRMLNPEFGLENAESGFIFKNGQAYYEGNAAESDIGVKALDDLTLELTFEIASLETLFSLARYPYFPVNKGMVEANGVTHGAEADKVLTNGPFTVTQWTHEDKIVMEKNEHYWNSAAINLTKVTNVIGVTPDTAADMMATGQLDIYIYRDITMVEPLESAGFNVESIVNGYQFVQMNAEGSTDAHTKFMGNTNFRLALNYAVSRAAITSSVYPGAEPAYRYTAPTMMGTAKPFNEEYPLEGWPAGGDAQKAKEHLELALAELGATIDDVPELSLLCFESQGSMTVLQAVQDMLLSTLGIKSKIDPQPIQQMIGKAMAGEWDMWWGGKQLGAMDWGSPDSFAGDYDYTTNTNSFIQYTNEEYSAIFKQMREADTVAKRKDLLFEMEKILCNDPPAVLIGWTQRWVVFSEGLSGFMMTTEANYIYMDKAP